MKTPPTTSSLQPRVTRSKQKVLGICGTLFVDQGFENVSVENILQESGIARSTFYRLFENKEAVLEQLTCPAFFAGESQLRKLRQIDGRELMRELLNIYVNMWESHADGMILAIRIGKQYQHIIQHSHDKFVQAMQPIVNKIQRQGVLRNGDAKLSTIIIARTSITLLQIYRHQPQKRALFINAMEGLLLI
ncbi:TetR/AcrR family transcriptional regulator [Oceanicoccus sp. KOV_DT_Chl]|uniref:TetR/AcrR family transcriptional regulator n=1 Tax=Oceanicoccus sp. KOV_DT_Chl TaxID=1904639 RepID=UPI000C7BF2E6|nr:TetR/AcrR family transcriptional regulator [Oceanicoccus sp. KOV_DT_Chl]